MGDICYRCTGVYQTTSIHRTKWRTTTCVTKIHLYSILFLFYSILLLTLCVSFQGVCSAYDVLIVCRLDFLQVLGLRITPKDKSKPVLNARFKLAVSPT